MDPMGVCFLEQQVSYETGDFFLGGGRLFSRRSCVIFDLNSTNPQIVLKLCNSKVLNLGLKSHVKLFKNEKKRDLGPQTHLHQKVKNDFVMFHPKNGSRI